jgi:hypothetical protein
MNGLGVSDFLDFELYITPIIKTIILVFNFIKLYSSFY